MNRNEEFDLNKAKNTNGTGKPREARPIPAQIRIIRNNEEFIDPSDPGADRVRTKLTREELLAGHSVIAESQQIPSNPNDPRFKSPDEFLMRAARKKTAPDPIIIETDKPAMNVIEQKPVPAKEPLMPANAEPLFGMPELSSLRVELDLERNGGSVQIENEEKQMRLDSQISPIKIEQPSSLPGFATARLEIEKPREDIVAEELKKRHEMEIQEWKDYASNVKVWQAQVMEIMDKMRAELKKAKSAERENESLKNLIKQKEDELKATHHKSKATILDWMKGMGRAAS